VRCSAIASGIGRHPLAADLSLRGADALYVALSYHLKVPLVTWDRQQRERAGERVAVHTPGTDGSGEWSRSRLNETTAYEYR